MGGGGGDGSGGGRWKRLFCVGAARDRRPSPVRCIALPCSSVQRPPRDVHRVGGGGFPVRPPPRPRQSSAEQPGSGGRRCRRCTEEHSAAACVRSGVHGRCTARPGPASSAQPAGGRETAFPAPRAVLWAGLSRVLLPLTSVPVRGLHRAPSSPSPVFTASARGTGGIAGGCGDAGPCWRGLAARCPLGGDATARSGGRVPEVLPTLRRHFFSL